MKNWHKAGDERPITGARVLITDGTRVNTAQFFPLDPGGISTRGEWVEQVAFNGEPVNSDQIIDSPTFWMSLGGAGRVLLGELYGELQT